MSCTCTALPQHQPAAHAADCPVFIRWAQATPAKVGDLGPGNVSRGNRIPRHKELEQFANQLGWNE